jgi:enoyl-CoA hydratase/carnithine racemase
MSLTSTLAGTTLTLVLDRPERRNALDMEAWRALRDAALSVPAEVRAVIVTGTGGHFSAGMDLRPDGSESAALSEIVASHDEAAARAILSELKECIQAVAEIEVPTIAAIEGVCVGGGLEIALACDMRVGSSTARLGLPETRLGMIPDIGGCARLTRLVGPGRAADLITTGRLVSGAEALALGIVERAVEAGGALAAANAMADQIALNAPQAVRLALNVIRLAPEMGLDEALAMETGAGAMALTSGEPREGIAAFVEKRAPRWA